MYYMVNILTKREMEVVNKKLRNEKLNQQDSNYLSRFVRPKLREISKINAKELLGKLRYDPKISSMENKIKNMILKKIKKTTAIVLHGSVVQTNYSEYNDIDVLIVTKDKNWKNPRGKYQLIKSLKVDDLNLDIQIITEKELYLQYSHNPSLIYQLEDRKIIYGKVNLPKKIKLHNIDLRMKLDWSDVQDNSPQEIYKSLRNAILVKLLLKKIIDNKILQMEIEDEIGKKTIDNLKNNRASIEEKKLAKLRLKNLIKKLENNLQGKIWEKRVQLTV